MSASPSHARQLPLNPNNSESVSPVNGDKFPPVLNLAEAAAFVRCSRAHLSNIIHGKIRGIPRLPSVRIGRRVLFRRESLEQWLRQAESTSGTRPVS
jgi:excisionase family DNA binding protein